MLHQSDSEASRFVAVRDGQSAPVTCSACGCRLEAIDGTWRHFNPLGGRDARGCRVACVDADHDETGRSLVVSV
jgi:hypothetical protein